MIIHEIHGNDSSVLELIKDEFRTITDVNTMKNYHPDFADLPGNFFKILDEGRYSVGKGKYYVVEDSGKYICSAGWNEYGLEPDIALLLTRMYVTPKHRCKYIIGKTILPKMIQECEKFKKLYITVNDYNISIYNWFLRNQRGKRSALFADWPKIYKNFKPVGKKNIYYTDQYVVELIK